MTKPHDDTAAIITAAREVVGRFRAGGGVWLDSAIYDLAAVLPPEPREPGWYWVRWEPQCDWKPAFLSTLNLWDEGKSCPPAVIGPRRDGPQR